MVRCDISVVLPGSDRYNFDSITLSLLYTNKQQPEINSAILEERRAPLKQPITEGVNLSGVFQNCRHVVFVVSLYKTKWEAPLRLQRIRQNVWHGNWHIQKQQGLDFQSRTARPCAQSLWNKAFVLREHVTCHMPAHPNGHQELWESRCGCTQVTGLNEVE